ncbi:MAG TPA: winged helix-turn-helix domain-containing protein [Pyrinomonadaceae bacterium]|nr:winged helix-turn-helix domain-containing protein [Pyrinomonadaceae bacterium]
MENKETKELYEFGGFQLDVRNHRLLKNREIIPLTSKEFEVLLMLVNHAGEAVGKNALLEKVWTDTFVEEGTLTRNISWLRKKLAPDGEKIIETVPRLGYRLIPEVRKVTKAPIMIFEEQINQKITIEETFYIEDQTSPTIPLQLQPKGKNKYFWWAMVLGVLLIASISVFTFLYLRNSTTKTIILSKSIPFSGLSGRENMPSFSPDGKQITFVWDGDQGNFDIYTKLIGTGEPLRLTRAPENDFFPVFSPDGKSIAFIRNYLNKSEVFLIPALGGVERKICELNSISSSLAFSPDGKTLSVIDSDADKQQFGIFLVDIETGNKKRLTTPPEFVSDYETSFSPDGKKLAFLRVFNKQIIELFVIPIAGGEPLQLTQDKSVITGLAWGKEGKSIIFASRRTGNQLNLWQIPAIGGEPVRIVTGEKNVTNPAVSADGKNIAFVEELRDTNLWQIDFSQSATKEHKLIVSSQAEHSPIFSPDDKKIAFASDRTGNYEIWLSDADGKNQQQLTQTGKSAGSPRFSPNGKMIAFDVQDGERSDIFTISVDGGKANKIVSLETRAILPSWSADGQFIYFTSNKSGSYQLWKISIGGGEAVQLTKQGAFESFAAPDGKFIYYTKARGEMGIWKITTEGNDETAVSGLEDAGFWRFWAVTNEGIYYVAYAANPPFQIKLFDFKTAKTSELITTEKTPIRLFSGFAVSPTDKKIIFAQSDLNRASIMLAKFQD